MEKIIEFKNVSFKYEDESENVLKGVSLELFSGQFTCILGHNGSGKSTLAKLIAGIQKPTSGEIYFNGTNITDMSITERANAGISFAFQQPVRFKGIQVIDLLRIASGKELSINEACSYLSEVGLCARDYINREVDASLSGGELKRIEIATIIARGTKTCVFDEPEAGIDLWSFKNLIKVFEKMHNEKDSSIIIISHQERILNIADEIVVIAGGEIKDKGKKFIGFLSKVMNASNSVEFTTAL